ncbi:MAG: UPF0280 family protein, partial [Methylocella sp.]
MRGEAHMLSDGRRLHLHDGPIDLIIGADGPLAEVARAYDAARVRFAAILDELCAELPLLRQPTGPKPQGSVAQRMWRATLVHARQNFITPMAAVAGCVAEEILAAMVSAADLDRAYVNNGGDIAFHLSPSREFQIGLIDRPDCPSLFAQTSICACDPVRGIATSGWRGRSFSLGIADAVTVLAATAGAADAAATIIANAVNLPGHPAITRIPAEEIQPDNDLGSCPVTRAVGPLSASEIAAALDRGAQCAQAMMENEIVVSCALH